MKIVKEFARKMKYVTVKIDEKKLLYAPNGMVWYKLPLPIEQLKNNEIINRDLHKKMPQHTYPLL